MLGVWFLVLFPAVPVLLFLRVLHTKRKFLSVEEAHQFLQLEATARQLKSISGTFGSFTFFSKVLL